MTRGKMPLPTLRIPRVAQADVGGCGAATLAMIVGCTYDEAKAQIDALLWSSHGDDAPTTKPVDWSSSGTTGYHLDRVLYAHGFFKQTRYAAWGLDLSVPFAPIHYAIVQQPSNNHHFVVMLHDGRVLDPLSEGEHRLSDWQKVLQVCGLTREMADVASASTSTREPACYGHCGMLGWTVEKHGRVTHKQSCPRRVEPWCQTHPSGCPEDCKSRVWVEAGR